MADYSITFARSATKELAAIPEPFQSSILQKIEALASAPYPHGCKKLRGNQAAWRIRIGKYRVIYTVSPSSHMVDISAVSHRQSAYK